MHTEHLHPLVIDHPERATRQRRRHRARAARTPAASELTGHRRSPAAASACPPLLPASADMSSTRSRKAANSSPAKGSPNTDRRHRSSRRKPDYPTPEALDFTGAGRGSGAVPARSRSFHTGAVVSARALPKPGRRGKSPRARSSTKQTAAGARHPATLAAAAAAHRRRGSAVAPAAAGGKEGGHEKATDDSVAPAASASVRTNWLTTSAL